MPQVTLDQRRLETLRRQLYGKEQKVSLKKDAPQDSKTYSISTQHSASNVTALEDTSYLRTDLTKIAMFSVVAIGLQLILFWSLQMKLIHLNI